ncbi:MULTISPECIES: hypothetical protein [Bacillus]|uniref:hypothetical protein n=1 Tax=Bacillus TaxID=1386 RepID=UPI000BB815A5|nr:MULTISPECIES: hypothetical protein [Bacillus]
MVKQTNRFHACATCIHFERIKIEKKMFDRCKRLGYETKAHYQFTCWTPKEEVKKLMDKEKLEDNS